MPTIAVIDPGQETGCFLFDLAFFGNLVMLGTIRDCGKIAEYVGKLEDMKQHHDVQLAVIEDYVNAGMQYSNAYKVYKQIDACQEVFKTRVMILNCQWNPMHHNSRYQKKLAASIYGFEPANEHETAASLMARYFIEHVRDWARFLRMPEQDVAFKLARELGKIPNRAKLNEWINQKLEEKKVRFTA
jgi:hypothetical protein